MGFFGAALSYLWEHPGFLLAGAALYVFVYVLSIFFSAPKPGRNPFVNDVSRPAKPLVTDSAARDKVLKQGFVQKKVPENLDVVVVGSGIGGLTAAVLLAKAGKKVLVLEQHDQAGGCCHTFIEKGFEFDVGIHYVGELRQNTVTKLLMNQLSEGQLQFCDLMDNFENVAIGQPGKQKMYPFVAGGKDKWKAAMLEQFPKEEKALDKYLQLLKEVRQNMLGQVMVKFMSKWMVRILINTGLLSRFTKYFEYSRRTTQEVLDELTTDKDLKAVLSYSFGDYGTLPKESSFAMHAALINHYMYGASYPRGGASEIAFHMIPIIERAGGRVLVRAPVTKILTDSRGRATGVRVGKGGTEVDIRAPIVISDAGAINTFKKLLPKEVAAKSSINSLIGPQVKSGVGAMSLFVGLKGTAAELGLEAKNVWAFTGNDLNQISEDYLSMTAEDASTSDVPLLFISFPSTKDPTYNDRFPGKSVCTVVTLANWEWFSKWENGRVLKRGEEYDAIKDGIGHRMWEQVVALFPQLEDKVEYLQVGSPVTNKFYLDAPKGEIYGLDHSAKRFGSPMTVATLRPDTDIPGLLLTGQDVMSCGFFGALFGGLLCASTALNRNLWDDLIKLRKTVQKSK